MKRLLYVSPDDNSLRMVAVQDNVNTHVVRLGVDRRTLFLDEDRDEYRFELPCDEKQTGRMCFVGTDCLRRRLSNGVNKFIAMRYAVRMKFHLIATQRYSEFVHMPGSSKEEFRKRVTDGHCGSMIAPVLDDIACLLNRMGLHVREYGSEDQLYQVYIEFDEAPGIVFADRLLLAKFIIKTRAWENGADALFDWNPFGIIDICNDWIVKIDYDEMLAGEETNFVLSSKGNISDLYDNLPMGFLKDIGVFSVDCSNKIELRMGEMSGPHSWVNAFGGIVSHVFES